jgi:hypothetical protein
MFISQEEKESIRREFNNIWNNIGILEKVRQNLFAKDNHGTIRPKVDMLGDVVDRTVMSAIGKVNTNMWIEVNKLHKRIDNLEKK